MQILADRVIANAAEAFSNFGDVTLFDGRELDSAMLKNSDALLIRSVTKVDAALLASTPIRFVGTATAGTDHVDIKSLERAGITFASAPACNANAVAEFVVTSIAMFCVKERLKVEETRVGIIGHGAVGSRVEQKLLSLGFECVLNDPFKAGDNKHKNYVSLDTVIQTDIVTLHTPLTMGGPYPTRRLIDTSQINQMENCRLLINAARGGIVNEEALAERMSDDPRFNVQLDCWENEPLIDRQLIAKTFRASPHVAGHSMEARQNATMMLVESLFRWCHAEPGRRGSARQLSELLSDSKYEEVNKLTFPQGDRSNDSLSGLVQLLGQCCPIDEINNAMLGLARLPETEVGGEFDRLRRQFAGRREFTAYQVPIEVSSRFEDNTLAELGFRVG